MVIQTKQKLRREARCVGLLQRCAVFSDGVSCFCTIFQEKCRSFWVIPQEHNKNTSREKFGLNSEILNIKLMGAAPKITMNVSPIFIFLFDLYWFHLLVSNFVSCAVSAGSIEVGKTKTNELKDAKTERNCRVGNGK